MLKTFISAVLLSSTAHANLADGKLLYEESCAKCHHSPYQTLGWNEMTNILEVTHMVEACSDYFRLDWNRQDVRDTVEYLNNEFFFFSTKPGE